VLLVELSDNTGQVTIHRGNKCAISIIQGQENTRRVKHIDVIFVFITEQQELFGIIKMSRVSTEEQLADILPKPIARKKFEIFII
jgi:hypothetical protein